MKMRLLLVGLAVALGGCAAIEENEAVQQERWLQQAGFRVVHVDTPAREAAFAKITPYKLEAVEGQSPHYRYADPAKRVVYIGTPGQYTAYQQIAVSAKSRRAANLASMTSSSVRVMGPMVW